MFWLIAVAVTAALVLDVASLRHVYAVGTAPNDHFVAAVVTGCMGWYALMFVVSPSWARPLMLIGMIALWGMFFCVHRTGPCPEWALWILARPSQIAYAFALWGGLFWLVRVPWVLWCGHQLLWPGGWLLPAMILALLGFLDTHAWGNRDRVERVEGLPIRIVHISDIHASPLMHRRQINPLIRRINAFSPDLVLITGDLVTPFSEKEHGFLLDALSKIRAPVYACPGNHDLPILAALSTELEQIGIAMLVDKRAVVRDVPSSTIEIVGVNYHETQARERFEEVIGALPESPEGSLRILLTHDPELGRFVPHGRFDLVLSGHTHGGQVGLNMIGIPLSAYRLLGRRDQGWWKAGGAPQYIHRGNWMFGVPPRLGVAGEVTLLVDDG